MPATISSLEFLGDRFAGHLDQAARLYESDQAFRDLCNVHAVCMRGVRRSEESGSASLGIEYAAQGARLAAELLRRLQITLTAPTRAH